MRVSGNSEETGSRPAPAGKDRIITQRIGDETGWTTARSLGEVGATSVHSKPVFVCSDCTFRPSLLNRPFHCMSQKNTPCRSGRPRAGLALGRLGSSLMLWMFMVFMGASNQRPKKRGPQARSKGRADGFGCFGLRVNMLSWQQLPYH